MDEVETREIRQGDLDCKNAYFLDFLQGIERIILSGRLFFGKTVEKGVHTVVVDIGMSTAYRADLPFVTALYKGNLEKGHPDERHQAYSGYGSDEFEAKIRHIALFKWLPRKAPAPKKTPTQSQRKKSEKGRFFLKKSPKRLCFNA